MLNLIQTNQQVIVNGIAYASAQDALSALAGHSGRVEIILNSKSVQSAPSASQNVQKAQAAPKQDTQYIDIYRIEVRQYMTKKATPDFDLMKKINDDNPMPGRRMYGEVLEEKKGMIKMSLHMRAEKNSSRCAHCMRTLTHPVSMYYGIGPVCGEHFHFAPMSVLEKIADEEELFRLADEKLRATTWTGWIPKSAIESFEVIEQIKVTKGA